MARRCKIDSFVEKVLSPFRKSRRTTIAGLVAGLLRCRQACLLQAGAPSG